MNVKKRKIDLQSLATIMSIVVGIGGLALGVWQARMTQKMIVERRQASTSVQ